MSKRQRNTKIFEKDFAAHELLSLDCYKPVFDKKILYIIELTAGATALMLVVLLVVHGIIPKYEEIVIKCIIIAIPCLTVFLFVIYWFGIFLHNKLIINAEATKAKTRIFYKEIDRAVQKYNNGKDTFMGINCIPEDVVNADYEDEFEEPLEEDEENSLLEDYVSSESKLPLVEQQTAMDEDEDEDFDEEDEMSIEEILDSVDRILNRIQ